MFFRDTELTVGRLERRPTHSTKLSHVVKFKFGSERPQDKEFPDSQGQERFLYNMATYGNWRLNNLTLHAHAGVTWAVSATSVASAPQQNVGMKGRTTYCKKIWGWREMKIRLQDLHQFQATSPSACDFWISILSIWPFVLDISQFLLVSTYVRGAHIPMSTSIPSPSHLHSKCGSATRRGQCGLPWAVQLEKLNI